MDTFIHEFPLFRGSHCEIDIDLIDSNVCVCVFVSLLLARDMLDIIIDVIKLGAMHEKG